MSGMITKYSQQFWFIKFCLNSKDRRLIGVVTACQVLLSLLDLLAVALIGILGALTMNGVRSLPPGDRIAFSLSLLRIENEGLQKQVVIIALLATGIFLAKTYVSIKLTKFSLYFLSSRSVEVAKRLTRNVFSESLVRVQRYSTQKMIFMLTTGVNLLIVGVIGAVTGVIADAALLIFLFGGLFVANATLAATSITIFVGVGLGLNRVLHNKVTKLAVESSDYSIKSNEKISELISTYREILVRSRREYYVEEIATLRSKLASITAELTFTPNISKYVVESTVLFSSVIVSAAVFLITDVTHGIALLAIFLAAGLRIAPAILRIQQATMQIKTNLSSASDTLCLIAEFPPIDQPVDATSVLESKQAHMEPEIRFNNVSFKYPESENQAISNVDLIIPSGSFVAITGPSGAGKSTLVDLMLGVIEPSEGSIFISGMKPSETLDAFPGSVGYVPQQVAIINGDISQNVGLGFPDGELSHTQIINALTKAKFLDFVTNLPNGLKSEVGEHGARLSGGQKQRLGIARALYTGPKLLVLDEATSALDSLSEAEIGKALDELRGQITMVVIAHRLATVRHADIVFYLEEGKLIAHGSFEEVRNKVPNFDSQAKLLGI